MAKLTCSDGTVVEISKETEAELKKAFGPKPEPKFGDVVTCIYGKRVMLYDDSGRLWAHDRYGSPVGSPDSNFYVFTDRNIFTHNLLDLND